MVDVVVLLVFDGRGKCPTDPVLIYRPLLMTEGLAILDEKGAEGVPKLLLHATGIAASSLGW